MSGTVATYTNTTNESPAKSPKPPDHKITPIYGLPSTVPRAN